MIVKKLFSSAKDAFAQTHKWLKNQPEGVVATAINAQVIAIHESWLENFSCQDGIVVAGELLNSCWGSEGLHVSQRGPDGVDVNAGGYSSAYAGWRFRNTQEAKADLHAVRMADDYQRQLTVSLGPTVTAQEYLLSVEESREIHEVIILNKRATKAKRKAKASQKKAERAESKAQAARMKSGLFSKAQR